MSEIPYPFRAEPPRLGHHREYPPSPLGTATRLSVPLSLVSKTYHTKRVNKQFTCPLITILLVTLLSNSLTGYLPRPTVL